MNYLTRLSQQTGLAPSPLSLPPKSSLRSAVQDSGLQPPLQPSAPLGFSQTAASVQSGPDPSQQGVPAPKPPRSEDWRVTDSGVTVPSASPETTADSSQLSVMVPEVTVERSQALAHETPPMAASLPQAMTYLQTLQAAREWVSTSLEESRLAGIDVHAEAVPGSGLSQTLPMAPGTVQVINPADLAISPSSRLDLRQASSPWDRAANSTPFPASTAEPTTVISIGSIQVTVEGPPAPPASAPARRAESPRPPARLSRHYLRLR